MLLKKISAVLSVFVLLLMLAVPCMAAETVTVTPNNDTRVVTIEGTTIQFPGTVVTISVWNPNVLAYDPLVALREQNVYTGETVVESDYTYSASFKLKENAMSGEYKLNIYIPGQNKPSEHIFNFSNIAMAEKVVTAGKGVNADAFRTALDNGARDVDVAAGKDYLVFNEKEKSYVAENVYGKFENAETQDLGTLKALLITEVSKINKTRELATAPDRDTVLKLLNDYSDLFLLSTDDIVLYNELEEAKKEEVIVALSIAVKACSFPEEVSAAYKQAVADAAVPEDEPESSKPSNSGGGGGGGGFRGGKVAVSTEVVTNETITEPVPESDFKDIANVPWATNAITVLCDHGIVNGREGGMFYPQDNVTREEMIKLLITAFDIKSASQTAMPFTDVTYGAWYYESLLIAYQRNIVNGVAPNLFGTGQAVTRQDMAVLMYNTLKYTGKAPKPGENSISFTDSDAIADYAKEAVSVFAEAGIINGRDDGNFAPHDTATRAEAAKLLYELLYRFNIL